MNNRSLLLLAVVTAVAVTAAYMLHTRQDLSSAPEPAPLLAGLEAIVNDVDRIRLVGAGENVPVTLVRGPSGWEVAERGYPADAARVRALLLLLGQGRRAQAATANPAHHGRLGLTALDSPAATGTGIELSAGARSLPRLIVGLASQHGEGSYVRMDGDSQTWLSDRDIDIERQPGRWLAPELVDIPAGRVVNARLEQPDGTAFGILRQADAVLLEPNPEGRPPAWPGAFDQVLRALERLELEDVLEAADVDDPAPEDRFQARFRTGDGLQIDVTAWIADARHLVRMAASPAPREAGPDLAEEAPEADLDAEIRKLNERFDGRVFVVPNYRHADLTRPLSGLLAPPEDPAEAHPPPDPTAETPGDES